MTSSSPLQAIEIVIEVPRGGFVKRDAQGALEFVSPLPCPFNYGSVPALAAADGDALDAVVLGPRLAAGRHIRSQVQAVIVFLDAGMQDDKLICAERSLTAHEQRLVLGFFRLYARGKQFINFVTGRPGHTLCLGWGDATRTLAAATRR